MQEIFAQIQEASQAFFEDTSEGFKRFAEREGLDVSTPKGVDAAMEKYNKALRDQQSAIDNAKQAQAAYNVELRVVNDLISVLAKDIAEGFDEVPDRPLGEWGSDEFAQMNSETKEFVSSIQLLQQMLKSGFDVEGFNTIREELIRASNRGVAATDDLVRLNDALIKLQPFSEGLQVGTSTEDIQYLKEHGAAIDSIKAKTDAATVSQKALNQATQETALPEQTQQTDVIAQQLNATEQAVGTSIEQATIAQNQHTAAVQQTNAAAQSLLSTQQAIASTPLTVNNPFAEFNTESKGGLQYFANGGRGTDTIPAMLSQGEFVTNARSSRRFFSQLQAINAGQQPVYKSEGGDTYNTNVGDIHVSGANRPEATARAIMKKIRREERRGSGR